MTKEVRLTEGEYRGIKLPSSSLIKRIDASGPKAILSVFKGGSEPMDFGDLVDCILLQPEEIENKFYFKAVNKPTGQLLQLADHIVNLCNKEDLDINSFIGNTDGVLEMANTLNLFGSVKVPSKRIEQFDNNLFWGYLDAMMSSKGKTVFTPDTYDDSIEAVSILRTSPNVSRLFSDPTGNVDFIRQLKLIGEIEGYKCKGMLDLVEINHDDRTITPYDLKCTDVRQKSFQYIFTKMKYYIQSSMYSAMLVDWAKKEYPEYVVTEFKFIVYSRADKYPFVWIVSDSLNNDGFYGFVDYKGNRVSGVLDLLSDYYYYINNQQFTIEREFIENNELYLI